MRVKHHQFAFGESSVVVQAEI